MMDREAFSLCLHLLADKTQRAHTCLMPSTPPHLLTGDLGSNT